MSLLVFNSGTKIAQSIISSLYASGVYEKIICADIFPAYHILQQLFQFKDNLQSEFKSSTTLQQQKITDKSDLKSAISQATDFLYISHDYYTQVPCKNNLLVESAKISAESKNIKQFVALTPEELINFQELYPRLSSHVADREARRNFPAMVNIKPDIMFGEDCVVLNKIMAMIVQQWSIYIEKMPAPDELFPIHSDDVTQIVTKILTSETKSTYYGKNYVAKGKQHYTWNEVFTKLEDSLMRPYKANLKKHQHLARFVTPSRNNLISELIWQPFYLNIIQLINKYEKPWFDNFQNINEFNLDLKSFDKTYAKGSQFFEVYLKQQLRSECKYSINKNLFY